MKRSQQVEGEREKNKHSYKYWESEYAYAIIFEPLQFFSHFWVKVGIA